MGMFDIVYWPDPVLTKVSEPVEDFDGLEVITEELFKVMKKYDGMGLSAPQVGMLKRIIVLDPPNTAKTVMINPEILEAHGSIKFSEGCLSFPGYMVDVERANEIYVRFQDLDGEWLEGAYEGVPAVCVQHEIDHLNGITMLKYVSRFQRELITKKMKRKYNG